MGIDYRISTWDYLFYHRPGTLEGVIGEIRDAGYGVEVFPRWFDEDDLFKPIYRQRLRILVGDIPSSIHGAGPETMDHHQAQIDTAADTESDVIVVHLNHMRLAGEEPDFLFAQEVLDRAQQRGIIIALENGPLPLLQRASENLRGLRFCVDTGHVYHHPEPMRTVLDTLGEDICHLHIEDTLGNSDHYVPGTGTIPMDDWRYLLQKTEEIGFSGAWVLEIRPRRPLQHAEQTMTFLNQAREGMHRKT